MKTLKISTLIIILCIGSFSSLNAAFEQAEVVIDMVEQDKKEMALEDLPEAIQKDMKERYADAGFKAAYALTDVEGLVIYEVHLVKNDTNIELKYNADGEILK